MRTAAITLALLCSTAIAEDGVWRPSDNGNLLWQKQRQTQVNLVPSRVVPISPDASLFTDVDRGVTGTVGNIGGGQYLVSEDGPNGSSLNLVTKQPDGGMMWTGK